MIIIIMIIIIIIIIVVIRGFMNRVQERYDKKYPEVAETER